MIILSYGTLKAFFNLHPLAKDALSNWYRLVSKANWSSFNEMRKMFNAVDAVGNDRYVFNIRGNNYRLISLIHFNIRTVYVLFIGTHNEYDKIDATNIQFKK